MVHIKKILKKKEVMGIKIWYITLKKKKELQLPTRVRRVIQPIYPVGQGDENILRFTSCLFLFFWSPFLSSLVSYQ